MNRRRALKSVLAFGAAAPISIATGIGLSRDGKPQSADDLVTRESAESYANVVAEAWARTYEKNLPRPGTFEWAMQRMREGYSVRGADGNFAYRLRTTEDDEYIEGNILGFRPEPTSDPEPFPADLFPANMILATDWEIVS